MKAWMIALERLTLKAKLLLVIAGLLLLTIVTGVDALIGTRRLAEQIHHMYTTELLGLSAIKEARFNYAQVGRIVRQIILTREPVDRERALKQLADVQQGMRRAVDEAQKLTVRTEGKKALAQFEESYAAYNRNVERVLALVRSGQIEEAQSYVASMDFQKPGIAANEHLGEMARVKEEGAKAADQRARETADWEEYTTLLFLFGGSGFGLLLAYLIAASIRPTISIRFRLRSTTGPCTSRCATTCTPT